MVLPAAARASRLGSTEASIEDDNGVGQGPRLPCRQPGLGAPRLGHQGHHRDGGETGAHAVGAAGQHDGHPRAEHDAGGVGVGEVLELLGHHVAGLQVRQQQDVSPARHRGVDLLGARGVFADGVVEGERAVEDAAGDLAAVGHLAQHGRVHRRLHRRVDGLHRGQDRHPRRIDVQHPREVDGVLGDVHLFLGRRRDVDGRVRGQEQARVGGHVHDEDVTDPALGAQAGGRGHHRAHHLVGVQGALHQGLQLAAARHGHRPLSRRVAVLGVDDAIGREIHPRGLGDETNAVLGPNQHRLDEPAPRRLDGTEQGVAVAGVHHGAGDGRHAFATLEEPAEAVVAAQDHLGGGLVRVADALGGRGHGDGAGDELLVGAPDPGVEPDAIPPRASPAR
jgi:hypothetical protein